MSQADYVGSIPITRSAPPRLTKDSRPPSVFPWKGSFLPFRGSPMASLCMMKHTGPHLVVGQCVTGRRRGIALPAVAQDRRRAGGSPDSSGAAPWDGVLTCVRDDSGLLLAFFDDQFCGLLGLDRGSDLARVPLLDVLGARLSADQRRELEACVAAGRRLHLNLSSAE